MPDQTVGAASVAGVLDAIYAGWSSATDYRGTSVPSTHVWTNLTRQTSGTTVSVHAEKPSGSAMSLNPGIIFAGAAAGAPAMASPDVFVANTLMAGIGKNIGAYNAWDNAAPWTSGQWFGYWIAANASLGALTSTVRVYVSQEVIVLDMWLTATTHYFAAVGAVLEPFTHFAGTTSETDSRLYGMVTQGSNALSSTFLQTSSSASWLDHSSSAAQVHGGVFQPGTGSLYASGRSYLMQNAASQQQQDSGGAFVGPPLAFCRSTGSLTQSGAAVGRLREIYYSGLLQGTLTRRNGATDLFHVLGANSSAVGGALILNAAA